MDVYCLYSTYILYRSVCPLVVQSYATEDDVINPLTSRIYTALNGNSVFDLRDIFQEHIPGIK